MRAVTGMHTQQTFASPDLQAWVALGACTQRSGVART